MTISETAANTHSLLDLIQLSHWQRLQDHVANVLGVALRTVTPSRELLVNPGWPHGIVAEQVIETFNVGEELEPLFATPTQPIEMSTFTTELGVTYVALPIYLNPAQAIAHMVVGPMVVGQRKGKAEFVERVSALGYDANEVWNVLLSLKPYSFSLLQPLLKLVEQVSNTVVQFSYQANQLSGILPYTAHVLDQAVVAYHTNRLLESLLGVATIATWAEGGSVMMAGEENGYKSILTIRAAQGLSDSIVAETYQHRDEGIAGLAITRGSILLIDDEHTHQEKWKAFLARHELASSLVAPIIRAAEQEPIGVINLRTSNRARRFTKDHVEILQRFLTLTRLALVNLHPVV